jgi:hypothetical protein
MVQTLKVNNAWQSFGEQNVKRSKRLTHSQRLEVASRRFPPSKFQAWSSSSHLPQCYIARSVIGTNRSSFTQLSRTSSNVQFQSSQNSKRLKELKVVAIVRRQDLS